MKTKTDVNLVKNFISEKDFSDIEPELQKAQELLVSKTGQGSEFTGWLNWASKLIESKDLINKIDKTRKRILSLNPISFSNWYETATRCKGNI